MTKYRRRLRFGYFPVPTAADPTRPLHLAQLAESLGLEYIGVQDHPYNSGLQDAWTLLTAIAMRTSRISVFTDVANLPLRSPAMLAKAAASLDLLTRGRVELGLGAGNFWGPITAMGGPDRKGGEAVAALEEAIQIMRLMWSGERTARFNGQYYQLAGVHPGPAPSHPINIWLGVNKPRALALAGRLADGWIPAMYPTLPPSELVAMSDRVDEAAKAAGRDPADIQRIWNIAGTIRNRDTGKLFDGTVKAWAESLADLAVNVGIDTFLLVEGENAEEQLRRFALEVVPYTVELVAATPGVPVTDGLAFSYQGAAASGATPAEEEICDIDIVDETSMESFPASDPPASSSVA
jgi:alkanesulfonate monooxygenase SsuD/methylene tetrahydromethanopterin reductase-like flavin-dependent oxidoreductase (luciferase family)